MAVIAFPRIGLLQAAQIPFDLVSTPVWLISFSSCPNMLSSSVRRFSLFFASAGGFARITGCSVGAETTLKSVNVAMRLSSSCVIVCPPPDELLEMATDGLSGCTEVILLVSDITELSRADWDGGGVTNHKQTAQSHAADHKTFKGKLLCYFLKKRKFYL